MAAATNTPALPTPYSAEYHARMEARYNRGEYADENNSCICCGRRAGGKTGHQVYIGSDSGGFIAYRDADHDMGWYPIGTKCRKALRAHGIPTYSPAAMKKLF